MQHFPTHFDSEDLGSIILSLFGAEGLGIILLPTLRQRIYAVFSSPPRGEDRVEGISNFLPLPNISSTLVSLFIHKWTLFVGAKSNVCCSFTNSVIYSMINMGLTKKEATKEKKKSKEKKSKLNVESIIWTIIVVMLIRFFIVQAYNVPSGSMENTILPGDFLLAAKFVYGLEIPYTHIKFFDFYKPPRQSIIVFSYPINTRKDFVKRCIGLPGDTIEIRNKVVYINGKALDEPYAIHKDPRIYPPLFVIRDSFSQAQFQRAWEERKFINEPRVRDNFGPIIVPPNSVFALGDNRDYSLDSRFWGPVPMKYIKGRPLIIYFSWDNNGPFWKLWERIRWKRFFKILYFASIKYSTTYV